ncbi:hypothetical protein LZ31DRAFT_342903 [Colletotrichum somersetense]|nr:hypothetical protein LZ31DRAFT_342903 [Colletotrichum somersetense]
MRVLSTFLFAPAVLAYWGSNNQPPANGPGVFKDIVPVTGQICCDPHGSPDPTGTCKGKNLNAYCCTSYTNDGTDDEQGCDALIRFTTGRDVLATAGNADICAYTNNGGNVMTGFIGCAA